jgi:hypothetical protein
MKSIYHETKALYSIDDESDPEGIEFILLEKLKNVRIDF